VSCIGKVGLLPVNDKIVRDAIESANSALETSEIAEFRAARAAAEVKEADEYNEYCRHNKAVDDMMTLKGRTY
jgi:hypothetical protein